jgi:type IV pilus assembly protein PilY1
MIYPTNKSLKYLSLAFLLSLIASLPVMADNVRLVNKPLVESGKSDVLPNLMFIMDNSGSMNFSYTPDWADSGSRQLFRNAAYNTQYYNPAIQYLPAVTFDGVSMPSYTDPQFVRTDAFYENTNYTMESHLGDTNTDTIVDLRNRANYFTSLPGEYCTTANLTNCINSSAKTTTHTFPAPIRWCNHNTANNGTAGAATMLSPPATACRAVRLGDFTNLRTTPTSTFTLTFTGSGSTTVSSIKINGIEIMRNPVFVGAGTTAVDFGNFVEAEIDACNAGVNGNCNMAGHSATGNSTLIVTSPAGASIGPIVVVSTGNITVAASAAVPTTVGRLGSLTYTNIISTNNAYPMPGSLVKDSDRDCAGSVCTYAEEMTNYANWYAYYRTRMQGMKTSTSLAFKSIDSRYRVGYVTINNQAANYLPIDKYDLAATQQKDKWYSRLFSTVPNGGTPLRNTLSMVGRIYAGKKPIGTADPVEYACQPNFALLTTDGYWNETGAGVTRIDGTAIGNLDGGSTARPQFDGGDAASSNTLADVAKYYYDTDIRNNTGADASLRFNNCTGALGQDVCGGGPGDEDIKIQNMTTLTLGLGIDGTLIYSNDYEDQETGDFADIKSSGGIKDWPVPLNNHPTGIDDLWHAAVNANGTYFSAKTPKELSESLRKALSDIQSKVGAGSAASASSLQPTAGDNFNYVASFETVKWIGNLEGRTVNLTSFVTNKSAAWCAENVAADSVQGVLPCTGTMASKVGASTDSRNIKFNNGGTLADFTFDNLNTTQQSFFETTFLSTNLSQWPDLTSGLGGQRDKAVGKGIVNFLRGQQGLEDRSSNTGDDRIFRFRETTLGDITESQPAFISKPVFNYTDPGYAAFKLAQASRPGRIFVGANDGMLHAFDATNGQEVWAFVPTPVIPKMWKLADRDYATNHVNLVNGDPTIAEICVASAAVCATSATASDWKTILVGGLSGGGRGYYALDITDPDTPQLLWEYTAQNNANLGYTFGSPIITKLADGTWVALLTSGYNNGDFDNNGTTANSPAGDGEGYLYVLNAKTGAVIKSFPTNEGDEVTPSGLGQISAFANDVSNNNLATYVYGGDLEGNLWRFNLSDPTGTTPFKLATLKDPTGDDQAITTAPQLGVINKKRVIFVGTGKYLELKDLDPTTKKQSLYAIKDDNLSSPLGNPRSSLIPQVLTTNGEERTATNVPVDFDLNLGWRVDFPDAGERMNIEPFLVNGVLLAPTIVPKSTSCSPGGFGWFNFFNYKTGSSVIAAGPVSEKLKSPVVGFNLVYDASGKPVVTAVESDNPTPQLIKNKNIATGGSSKRSTLFNKNTDGTYGRKSIWRELIR